MTPALIIGRRIRNLRRRKGLSQRQLAELIPGMSNKTISYAEHGQAVNHNTGSIAQALGVTVEWLRHGNEAREEAMGLNSLELRSGK